MESVGLKILTLLQCVHFRRWRMWFDSSFGLHAWENWKRALHTR